MAESSKLYVLLLICLLFISSASPILGCGYCGKPKHKLIKPTNTPKGPIVVPPIHVEPRKWAYWISFGTTPSLGLSPTLNFRRCFLPAFPDRERDERLESGSGGGFLAGQQGALKWAVENVVRKDDHLILVVVRPEENYEQGEMQL
ncbi:hypothetical protein ACFX13_008953 [Malus domestica]